MEKRVTVKRADGPTGRGVVDGYHDTYQVSYDPEGGVCTCPAGQNHRRCSHVVALELEVARQAESVAV